MKLVTRKTIALVMMVLTMIGIFKGIPVKAAGEPVLYDGIKSASFYAYKPGKTNLLPISGVSSKKQIKNLKCSNSKVASVSIEKRYNGYHLAIVPKKAGKVKISLTVKYGKNLQYSKKFNFKVTVLKYENPCKSFKIGSKQYASLFKNNYEAVVKAQNKKLKIDVKPNKGWIIKTIDAYCDPYKEVQSGDKIDMKNCTGIYVAFQNKKTHREQVLILFFGSRKIGSDVFWV